MKYVAVLPYAYKPFFEACLKTMHPDLIQNTLFIDNTHKNIGIMAAHNQGVVKMMAEQADWLIIISAAIRFGEPGGMDFVKVLEDNPDHYIIHAATLNSPANPDQTKGKPQDKKEYHNGVYGWHLTAFKREVFENIGVWDENFTPYGFDDIDLSVRVQKYYKGKPGWGTFPIDVSDTVMAHSINLGGVKSDHQTKEDYFVRKWGVLAGGSDINAYYDHPFNRPELPLSWWPQEDHKLANKNAWEYLRG